jgi:hypothetical protein
MGPKSIAGMMLGLVATDRPRPLLAGVPPGSRSSCSRHARPNHTSNHPHTLRHSCGYHLAARCRIISATATRATPFTTLALPDGALSGCGGEVPSGSVRGSPALAAPLSLMCGAYPIHSQSRLALRKSAFPITTSSSRISHTAVVPGRTSGEAASYQGSAPLAEATTFAQLSRPLGRRPALV